MKILAIDTSSDVCSVCLLEDNIPIQILEIKNGKTHSENLMPLIDELIKNNKLLLEDINIIACDKGPGSFTGIRIGISCIKAISEVKNIDVIGISSLEGLAYNENFNGLICSLIDARNNQVYFGIFDSEHNALQNFLADDISIALTEISKYSENIIFIGNGSVLHKDKIISHLKNKIYFSNNNDLTSSSIGKAAYNKFLNGEVCAADDITPLYLRKSQAERMKELGRSNN